MMMTSSTKPEVHAAVITDKLRLARSLTGKCLTPLWNLLEVGYYTMHYTPIVPGTSRLKSEMRSRSCLEPSHGP